MSRSVLSAVLCAVLLGFSLPARAEFACLGPQVGTSCTFKGYEFSEIDPKDHPVVATCRAVGQRIYVFVEDAPWTSGAVTQTQVNNLVTAWESEVPADAMNGMFQKIPTILNAPIPNLFDRDNRIYVVIHTIASLPLAPVTAYFRPIDYQKDGTNPVAGANGHEVLFLHAQRVASDERLSDLAYVLTDMLHYVTDPEELPWVRDVIARRMAVEMGYTSYLDTISSFSQDPGQSLLGDVRSDRLTLYPGVTTLFGVYLAESFTSELWSDWFAETRTGREGLERALVFTDDRPTFCDVLHGFALTNGLNRAPHRYETINLPRFKRQTMMAVRGDTVESDVTLTSYSGTYLDVNLSELAPDDELELELTFPDTQGLTASVALHSNLADGPTDLEDLPILTGRSTRVRFEGPAAENDHVLVVISRCAADIPIMLNAKVTVTPAPIPDGDVDPDTADGDIPDGDEPDGDVPDGDEPDGDTDKPDVIISGSKACWEIHACYSACSTASCRQTCVEDGTEAGQAMWEDFLYCIGGDFRGGVDCLERETAADRERCMSQQCPTQYEACRIPDVDDGLPGESGGGGCRQQGGISLFMGLLLVSLCLLRYRTRRT